LGAEEAGKTRKEKAEEGGKDGKLRSRNKKSVGEGNRSFKNERDKQKRKKEKQGKERRDGIVINVGRTSPDVGVRP